jgi:hypothetical protein
MRPDVLATHLSETIRGLVAPMSLRLAALEQARTLDDSHTAGALGALESVVVDVRDRLDRLESRAPLAGPQGPPGEPGPQGPAGRDGVDGKSLNYLGVHVAGKTYDAGDCVTHDGSVFYCNRMTTTGPGTSRDWQLMVKHGRDAGRR